MKKAITISLSPNTEPDDRALALRTLLQPWTWKHEVELPNLINLPTVYISSGRSALYALLKAYGIGAGDEVILQAFTCSVVPAAIQWTGAKPIYADISLKTFNLDPADVEKKITPATKAIIVQHTFGIPGPVNELKNIAQKHNVRLIEDCAHALGATCEGQPLGTFGDAAFFSFGRDKVLSCVFGGAVVSRDQALIKKIAQEQHALPYPPSGWIAQQLLHPILMPFFAQFYFTAGIGKYLLVATQKMRLLSKALISAEKRGQKPRHFTYRFSPALARLLQKQLIKLERYTRHRQQLVAHYQQALSPEQVTPLLRFPILVENPKQIHHAARQENILLGDWYDTVIAPKDVSSATFGYAAGSCPQAEYATKHVINLPTHPLISQADTERVIRVVRTPGVEITEIASRKQWDEFLDKLQPNTFLHTWEWGQLQQHAGETVRYVGFFENNQQIGAALLLTVNAKRGRFLFCPHGPIFLNEASTRRHLPAFVAYCKQLAAQDKAVAVRISPLLVTTAENQAAFRALGFRPAPLHMHTELTWMLDITPSEDKLLLGMRKTTRHAIKKAAGIATEVTTDTAAIDRFWPLYQATKHRHQFVPFSKDFISTQVKLFSENNKVYFVFARYQNQDVAAGIFMQAGKTVFYHHGASQKLPSSVPASHAIQWAAIKEAKRRGVTHYNFWGIARDDQPKHPFAGITIFKKGFGGYAVDYMHAQDLPLSLGYWKLWAVETYRKLKRGF